LRIFASITYFFLFLDCPPPTLELRLRSPRRSRKQAAVIGPVVEDTNISVGWRGPVVFISFPFPLLCNFLVSGSMVICTCSWRARSPRKPSYFPPPFFRPRAVASHPKAALGPFFVFLVFFISPLGGFSTLCRDFVPPASRLPFVAEWHLLLFLP